MEILKYLKVGTGGDWTSDLYIDSPSCKSLDYHAPKLPNHRRLYTRGPRPNSPCYAAAKMMRKLATFPVCNRGADKKTKSLTFHSTTVVSFQTLPPTPQSSHPLIPLPTLNKITSASRHIYLNLTMLTGRRRKEDIVIHWHQANVCCNQCLPQAKIYKQWNAVKAFSASLLIH